MQNAWVTILLTVPLKCSVILFCHELRIRRDLRAIHTTRWYARVRDTPRAQTELTGNNDGVHTDASPRRSPCERPFSLREKRTLSVDRIALACCVTEAHYCTNESEFSTPVRFRSGFFLTSARCTDQRMLQRLRQSDTDLFSFRDIVS